MSISDRLEKFFENSFDTNEPTSDGYNVSYEDAKISDKSFNLSHCGNSITISDFQYNKKDALNGNPYNTTFNIKVVSGLFSGFANCEYDIKEFTKFVKEINNLYEFRCFEVKLQEICYGSYIIFKISKTGHLEISGKIYGQAMLHSLDFEFSADQTSLKPFIQSLNRIFL